MEEKVRVEAKSDGRRARGGGKASETVARADWPLHSDPRSAAKNSCSTARRKLNNNNNRGNDTRCLQ